MYGVLVLPLSVFIFYIFSKYKIFFYLFIFVSCGLIYANFNQMNLYSKSIVHYDSMSKETWLESLFSKPKRHDYFKYMIHPNYDEAILGSYFKKDYCIVSIRPSTSCTIHKREKSLGSFQLISDLY